LSSSVNIAPERFGAGRNVGVACCRHRGKLAAVAPPKRVAGLRAWQRSDALCAAAARSRRCSTSCCGGAAYGATGTAGALTITSAGRAGLVVSFGVSLATIGTNSNHR
jgi:hypothetical protein